MQTYIYTSLSVFVVMVLYDYRKKWYEKSVNG